MRVGFVSAVHLGLSCMQAVYNAGGSLCFVLTLRDDVAKQKSGRVAFDAFCESRHIALHKVRNINDADAVSAIRQADLDWLFIVGWSQIARGEVLAAPRRGALGIHPTLLPIGRGRAPIPWAILHGLPETGVTLFKLDGGVDTGPIVAQLRLPIGDRETARTLYERVSKAHFDLIRQQWAAIANGSVAWTPQDHAQATYWPARRPEDGRLTLEMSVRSADRLIRAVTRPYPGAFLNTNEGVLRVWGAGAPFEDLGGDSRFGKSKRIVFADGWLDLTDWQLET